MDLGPDYFGQIEEIAGKASIKITKERLASKFKQCSAEKDRLYALMLEKLNRLADEIRAIDQQIRMNQMTVEH